MSIFAIIRIMSILLAIVASTMLLPAVVALFCGETTVLLSFIIPASVCIGIGLCLFILLRKKTFQLDTRSVFIAVALSWVTASFVGALPFYFSGEIPDFLDAFFESVSGFTTTGATILAAPEELSRSINFWRMETHWLGGMGIVALTVALLPLLGVGGFQLIKAETTGPEKGKITPKITMTAKILWFIYLGFTVLQTILLMFAGMDFIDALGHSFSTLGTGGYSSRNNSIGSYNSAAIDWICTVFMFLSGINFSLYYQLFRGKVRELFENTELKAYILIVLAAGLIVTLSIYPLFDSLGEAIRSAYFQVLSIISTTGFSTADYTLWPVPAQLIIFLLLFVGGCSGSTAGGFKVIRWVILGKQMKNETQRMLHPHGVFNIRLNKRNGRQEVVLSVAGFIFVYSLLVFLTTFVAAFNTSDLFSAFTTSLTLVGNVGPGFGMVGPSCNYGFFSSLSKLWFCFAMIAGRLEFYTMVIFFMPTYWKK